MRWILWFILFNRTHSSGENGISMWYWRRRRVVVILFRGSYRPDFQLWAWTCYEHLIKSFQALLVYAILVYTCSATCNGIKVLPVEFPLINIWKNDAVSFSFCSFSNIQENWRIKHRKSFTHILNAKEVRYHCKEDF